METTPGIHAWRVRAPSRRVAAVLVLAAIAGGLALAAFLWLRGYAPLDWNGNGGYAPDINSSGYVSSVDSAEGSDGKTVYFVRPGSFTFGFDLHNQGPLPVRVEGIGSGQTKPFALSTVGYGPGDGGDYLHRNRPLPFTIHSGGYRFLAIHLRSSCTEFAPGSGTTLSRVPLRYSYLSIFHRTAWVELPAAVTLRC